MTDNRSLHALFTALGYAGVVPFAAGALAVVILDDPGMRHIAERALIGYGAVILAFLGAVHWGVMLARPARGLRGTLIGSVLPSLVAWVSLLMTGEFALTLQIVAFGVFWLYEHRVLGPEILPPPYLALRRMLTLAVCSLLALALIGGR